MTVESVEENTLRVTFSLPVDVSTVRVTLTESHARTSLRVKQYLAVPSDDRAVDILLDTAPRMGSAYVLTVNTAVSITGKTINTGVDAVREFVA